LWKSVESDITTIHNDLNQRERELGDIQRQVQTQQEQLKLLGQSIGAMFNDQGINKIAQEIREEVQKTRDAVISAKTDAESARDAAERAANEAIEVTTRVKGTEKEVRQLATTATASSSAIEEARKSAAISANEASGHAAASAQSEAAAKSTLVEFNEALSKLLTGKEPEDRAAKSEAFALQVDDVKRRTDRLETHSLLSLTADECKQVQAALAERHYYRGRVDGVCLEGTANAIRAYQSARADRPQVTGILTLQELSELIATKPST
jgi:hypothetical protein